MQTRKLQIACPVCGSSDVSYSCNPSCCFNHVCADCQTTFEPVTRAAGRVIAGVLPPDPLPDAADPTAECAKCQSTAVYMTADYMTSDAQFVCGNCGALLELELTEIAPGR